MQFQLLYFLLNRIYKLIFFWHLVKWKCAPDIYFLAFNILVSFQCKDLITLLFLNWNISKMSVWMFFNGGQVNQTLWWQTAHLKVEGFIKIKNKPKTSTTKYPLLTLVIKFCLLDLTIAWEAAVLKSVVRTDLYPC